ncbi:MAG: UMP kinase [Patescibacteria group bacterium]
MASGEKIVISLGGSLVVPDEIDLAFLRDFKTLIEAEMKVGKSFVIITGGGKICRRYQDAARELGVVDQANLDWIGIYSTRLNATLLRSVFGKQAHPDILVEPATTPSLTKSILVGGGGVPGHSSDFAAVEVAEKTGAKTIINLSNIDYVYESDPRKNPDAKKIEKISWVDFRKIIPSEYSPGMNAPFDPVAAKKSQELGLEVVIMNGKSLSNLENYLSGKPFAGTVIKN